MKGNPFFLGISLEIISDSTHVIDTTVKGRDGRLVFIDSNKKCKNAAVALKGEIGREVYNDKLRDVG